MYQGDDLPPLSTVLDGTKCGNEMVSVIYDYRRRFSRPNIIMDLG